MSHTNHSDPALDPSHQHLTGHVFHTDGAHDPPVVHADLEAGPREEHHRHLAHDTITELPKSASGDGKTSKEMYAVQTSSSKEKGSVDDTVAVSKWKSRMNVLRTWKKVRIPVFIFIGMFFTSWWVSIVAQDKTRHKWLIPTILWLMIMARLITFCVPTRPLLTVANYFWTRIIIIPRDKLIPEKFRLLAAAVGTVAVILVATFVTKEFEGSSHADRAVSLFGCVVAIAGLYLTSHSRKDIQWHAVISGMLIQYIVALFVLRTGAGYDIFNFISFLARKLLGYATDGVAFLTDTETANLGFFFFTVLPAIIFFIAVVHLFYYWGVIQWAIVKFAYFFFWAMKVSGAEAVVAAASPFIGQGESAILIKPFIAHLTKAEIHQVMASGFATIAGSVLVAYIGMGVNAQALVSSCVMSIPASLATSKLRYPETEESLTAGQVIVPDDDTKDADNILHAFSNGAWLGLVIAGTIMTNLLCIIGLVALINALLTWFFGFWGIPALTLEQIFGYVFYPVAFLLGVPRPELYKVAKLIGIKVIQNEFVGYTALKSAEYSDLSVRAQMLATYALCGFANLGSVATQIGVLGQLAPSRRGDVAELALSALATGCISTLLSAAVAGMTMADLRRFSD